MSDAYGSYGNPYGVPPPYPDQIPPGMPPGVPPGEGPEQGPRQDPSYPPPDPAQLLPVPWSVPRVRRPGSVTAAGVIVFVLIGLSIAVLLLGVVGVVGAHLDSDPDDHLSTGGMAAGLVACALGLALCVTGGVFAGLALACRQWARVTTVVLAFLSAAFIALIGVGLVVDHDTTGEVVAGVVVLLLGLVAALGGVLLLLPPAGGWYRSRQRRDAPGRTGPLPVP
ncbi:hypothetical protein P5P86_00235 [Nocardioides sp. BP30]|uniref:hypothetical protein n=1 Tax=Nocardioides sp. BP30 TaxID=3036374 RepID=UPI002469418E|nr:hypothetical protein [Nocardioides sp. BP30]WGL52274.1 hypothetical protein P5P86_00235 [Nocardioides sp. BP30]